MNFIKLLNLGKPEKKEIRDTYSLDFSGPCGKRTDRCNRYMEYMMRPNPKYRSACESCEENSTLD
ncbi:MAG: hypothetical protein KJ697_03805 [Nanoarchaeota archaeon]|nr:hypothetical protein [Nanoarchaeota archaeon]MBU4124353.1 hypothetical protein [Nanoarchaeota archaeon]